MTPAANGTDERLDAVLEELRAIRRALEAERKPAKSPLKLPTGKVVERNQRGSYRADLVSHNDGKPIFVADPADVIE